MPKKSTRKGKRGPDPDRLKIEGNPQEALRKLLTPKDARTEDADEDEDDANACESSTAGD